MLAGDRKPEIPWDQFKGLATRESRRVFQEEEERENEVLVYICFKVKGLVLILTVNSGICV